MKNPTIATLLNIIPGIGYLYIGRKRAFALLIIAGIAIASIASLQNPLMQEYYNSTAYGAWDWVELLGSASMVAAFMYDGYREAMTHNAQQSKKSPKSKV